MMNVSNLISKSSDVVSPFNLLPDEMVIHLLTFVDADSLLNCKLVCKSWKSFIDAYVFQEKASRENEFVNNGKGYCSFSHIDSNTVRKLDYPWYVFYAICKHDPFHRNLVRNNCGQEKFNYWKVSSITRDCWFVEETPAGTDPLPNDPDFDGHTCCFASTYTECAKNQTIFFKDHGLTSTVMKLIEPDILFSDWYSGRFDSGCKYKLRVTTKVVEGNINKPLDTFTYQRTLQQWEANKWTKVTNIFEKQRNASILYIYHSGIDTQYWAGHYGTKISGTVVNVLLPIKLKRA